MFQIFFILQLSVADPDPEVLGLPDPDLLVRDTDPAQDLGPSIIKQK
jgi:hypothetical protein